MTGQIQNELTFQLIVESSPSAIVLVNHEGKIAYVNSQMEKLFGYHRTEIIGKEVELLIPDRYISTHPKFRNAFFQSPSVRAMGAGRELFARRKDNTEFPIEIGLNPIITVEGTLTLASIIDITERKNAEHQFHQVVESSPYAIVLVNQSGVIEMVNSQAELLFGYEREELINSKIERLIPNRFSRNHSGHRDHFFQHLETRAMGAGRDLFALRKNGSEVAVEIGLNPIETKKGKLVIATVVDITQRKEQELIEQRKLELESRNKELEQFAYIASHDLQEPLRTVSNYMHLFEEEYIASLDEQAKKYIESIKKATSRMSAFIKALLDISRFGRGKLPVITNLNQCLADVQSDLADQIKRSHATILVKELPQLKVYEMEVRVLFQNLISNAIKFQNPTIKPNIIIAATEQNHQWQFEIQDNGIGILPKHLNRIFEIFQRLHTQKEFEGNGIGLASSKRIVELHGGRIWAESEPGVGTTIYFTLPKTLNS